MGDRANAGIAVVTGVASGIGAAVAERVDADGHLVVGIDIAPSERPHAVHDIADLGRP